MRTLFGIILGVFVAVGGAYVHDSAITGPDRDTRVLVNWTVFNSDVKAAQESLTALWDRISESTRRKV